MSAGDVSVALCTRNGARYVAEQIRSICAQKPPPREIVLSDDASSDGTIDAVRQALADTGMGDGIDLVVLRNTEPLGVTRNFEQAVRACRGGLIALCDQDDAWHPDKLARMQAAFQANPQLLLLHSDAQLVDGAGLPLPHSLFQALEVQPDELTAIAQGRAFDVLLRRNLVTGATVMLRSSLLKVALPFSPEWVHDEWLAALAAATGRMDVLATPLIDYRQHGNNEIGAARPTFASKVRKAMDRRGTKHLKRLHRAEALLLRLEALGPQVHAPHVEAQRAKVAHQRFRATLPAARWRRLIPVLREAAAGRYERFGRGRQAVMQDLLERG